MRADRLLVERGLFDSRAQAQAAIAAGRVTADGVPIRKASQEIEVGARLRGEPAHEWVSRGGLKLAAALDHFGFDPAGCACLDVGAATGGFTDVLLARGARRVHAVDVGRGQFHSRLRGLPDVVVLEATDIRALHPEALIEPPSFITVDVSFISLEKVLPAATALAARPATLIALIKPQFEVGPAAVKRGVVRNPIEHAKACGRIEVALSALGWTVAGVTPSPILGGDGNAEFLVGATR